MNFAPFAFQNQVVDNTPKSAVFIAFSGYTTDASSYTMTQNLAAGNYVVVVHYESSVGRTLDSVQFSGSTGTSNATISSGGFNSVTFVRMSYITLTNSTTYDIIANLSGTVLRAGIALYRLNKVDSVVPNLDGSGGYIAINTSQTSSEVIACCWSPPAAIGVIIAASTLSLSTLVTWSTPNRTTNIIEDYDSTVESLAGFSGASIYDVDSNTTFINAAFPSGGVGAMVSLTWI